MFSTTFARLAQLPFGRSGRRRAPARSRSLGAARPVSVALASFCLFMSTATAEGQEPSVQRVRFQVGAVRALSPVALVESPRGADGVEWMAPSYDDRNWRTGLLREKNSIPEWKSRLYRAPVRVETAPGQGESFILTAEADDGLQVWLDGFKLGAWGSGEHPKLSGPQTIDLTQHLTVGDHLLAIRVDNGIADSSLIAELRVITEDSPDSLTVGDWFQANFKSADEHRRASAIERARKVARLHPDSLPALWAAFDSYSQIDPPDVQAAWDTVVAASRLGTNWHGSSAALLSDVGDYALIDSLLQHADWKRDVGHFRQFNAGLRLMLTGKRDAAKQEFESALRGLQEVPAFGWRANCLIEVGMLDRIVPALHAAEDTARRSPDAAALQNLADSFRKLGDYNRAKALLAQVLQVRRPQAIPPLSELAMLSGDFEEAERLGRIAVEKSEVTPTRGSSARREHQLRLAAVLGALGKTDEVKDLCAKIDVGPYPGQPAWSLSGIKMTLYPKLQIAKFTGDKRAMAEAARALYDALKVRATRCPCRDVDAAVLADLALALHESGMTDETKHMCGLIKSSVADIQLPANQAALGRASALLGEAGEAARHFGDAVLLAPDDWWIRKDAAKFGGR